MDCKILINGYDLYEAFGIVLEQGGLEKLEAPPTPREPFYNEWHGISGRDYDESTLRAYEAQIFEIPFLIIGNSMADYRAKKKDFFELIDFNGEFDFQIIDWGEAYRLRYKGVSSWTFINENIEGETSARFVIKMECNFSPTYMFAYLADNDGNYIVINDDERILIKTIYTSIYGG